MAVFAACVFLGSVLYSAAGFRLASQGTSLAAHDAALNESDGIVHNATANESGHALEEHASAAKATLAASGVPAPELTHDRMLRDLGVAADSKCSAGAAPGNLGCSLGCTCEWHQQCYPKYIYINDGAHLGAEWASKRFDVGACEPGMPILIVSSVGLFVGALLVVVTGRMLLLGQFAARDAVDAAAMHLPPAPYVKPPMVVVPAASVSAQAQPIVTAEAPRQHKSKKAPSDAQPPGDSAPSKSLPASSSRGASSSS